MNIIKFNTLIEKIDTTCKTMQSHAIRSVSKTLTLRNWMIGYYIVEFEQGGEERAVYGKKLIDNLAERLSYIKGLSATNLRLFRAFYLNYPQIQQTVSDEFEMPRLAIQQTVSVELQLPAKKLINHFTFSHFIEL